MKIDYKSALVAAVIAAGLIYASNNDVPLIGNTIRRALG